MLHSLFFLFLSLMPFVYGKNANEELTASWELVLVLTLLSLSIMLIYLLSISSLSRFLPDSCATIILGIVAGMVLNVSGQPLAHLVVFDPKTFFIYLLPPIIFESGYNLHKGNFFLNMGSILTFAFIGTIISTIVVGLGLYLAGIVNISYPLTLLDSMAFGSLISAVDPVATLAIFGALEVNPTLHMLVFGESVLNDAVAVVLFRTFISFGETGGEEVGWGNAFLQFAMVSLCSVAVGVVVALFSALVFKLMRLHEFPSLETATMFIFCYLPYLLAEALELSGIMAILFCGIVMSHYTHFNLSPMSQVTTHQTWRTLAFCAETLVFAFLGISVFSIAHTLHVGFVVCTLVLCMLGRAANIYPLAVVVNNYRTVQISKKEQFIMWFSGLRGAIAFSLALNVPSRDQPVIVTTTLCVVLFTVFVFGGGTLPIIKMLGAQQPKDLSLSKTHEINPEHVHGDDYPSDPAVSMNSFINFDKQHLMPIFRVSASDFVELNASSRNSRNYTMVQMEEIPSEIHES